MTVRYPLGAVYQHGYDEMGRPKTMIDAGTQTTVIGSATYGPAGELLTMGNETRQYNSRLQVTRITHGVLDLEYKYSATQNNGQITAMKDWQSGEEVNYAYDELKRLSSAVTVGPEWGNSYGYDGFGNLLQKNVVKGSAPYMNLSIDPATNKPYSGYSAAGLPTSGAGFDNDNRMIATTAGSSYQEYYAYSPAGKRVWNRGKRDIGGTWVDKEEVWFWGVTGQRMAFYSLTASGNPVFTLTSTNLYMGSKLVMSGGAAVKTDRLGSVGKFYPWGEERTPTGASGEKFATYYHDVQAAMNYADQRWHGTNGRFQVPDPFGGSATPGNPGSWNRFAYVQADPVGTVDPSGLDGIPVGLSCVVNGAVWIGDICRFLGDLLFNGLPVTQPMVNEAFYKVRPECDPSNTKNKPILTFIKDFEYVAAVLAQHFNIPALWILAWASQESGNGSSRNALTNGKYLNLMSDLGTLNTVNRGGWSGAVFCEAGVNVIGSVVCFPGDTAQDCFYNSVSAGLRSAYGRVLQQAAATGAASAFQQMARAGFDSTNSSYGANVAASIESIRLRMNCDPPAVPQPNQTFVPRI